MSTRKPVGPLPITADQRRAIIKGMSHPGDCVCNVCRLWWRLMGPDPETGRHGPFTEAEIGVESDTRREAA